MPLALADDAPVSEIMSRFVFSVSPSISLERLARVLDEYGVRCAPVVNDQGRLIGVVSRADLESARIGCAGAQPLAMAPLTVREIMTAKPISIPEWSSVSRACAVLWKTGVRRAPVVDARGDVTGFLSTSDVLRFVAGKLDAPRPLAACGLPLLASTPNRSRPVV